MFKPKIWLRLGALAVAGSATASPKPINATETEAQSKEVVRQFDSAGPVLAQSGRRGAGEGGEGGEGGEAGSSRPAVAPKVAPQQQQKSRAKQRRGLGGEGGEGGERGFGP